IRPLVVSHGANAPRTDRSRFRLEFDWTGTADPTAYLTVPEALRYLDGLMTGGWPALMARNREVALAARRVLCVALGVATPAPDSMIGSLAAVELPSGAGDPEALQRALFDRFGIEALAFVWPSPPVRLLRVSAQLYNTAGDYERLAAALARLGVGCG